jgi:eukaryotic-like serine/threonine-protein kinase
MQTPNHDAGSPSASPGALESRAPAFDAASADDASILGAVVDGFVVEALIAEGGMGVIYAAREISSGRVVALKALRACHASDAGFVSRFEREIGFATRVDHPNVAPVLGRGALPDGRPYYRMELYRGRTLGALVRTEGPLELKRALAVADQILAGLEAVHAAGIVHRDLTPENVLLVDGPRGEEHVLLLDFGLAHTPGVDTGDGVTPESAGSMVGTLQFMAPEQVTRSRAITARSDLFATALLLYYAVSGKLPFRGVDSLDVAVATVRRPPVPLRSERRSVPRALDHLISRALAKHPDARFASAAEMRAKLGEISGAPRDMAVTPAAT